MLEFGAITNMLTSMGTYVPEEAWERIPYDKNDLMAIAMELGRIPGRVVDRERGVVAAMHHLQLQRDQALERIRVLEERNGVLEAQLAVAKGGQPSS